MSKVTLSFMGHCAPEEFRCRVYTGADQPEGIERKRRNFVAQLAEDGVIECPAYDNWLLALEERGFAFGALVEAPEHGPGAKVKRWYLTGAGQTWWKGLDR